MEERKDFDADFPQLHHTPAAQRRSTAPIQPPLSLGTPPTFSHRSAYDLFEQEDEEHDADTAMEAENPISEAAPPPVPESRLPAFLTMLGESTITTNRLLISFIPDWIKHDNFTTLTEKILTLLLSNSTRRSAKLMNYQKPEFAEFFTGKPPLWMVLYQLAEQHGSFLMRLPIPLTFSPVGGFLGIHPPRFFTLPIPPNNKRYCLIQAVPLDFKETFLSRQELAFWRGIGAEYESGNAYVLTSAIEAHVEESFIRCVDNGELDTKPQHFSFLAPHYVNIQEDTATTSRSSAKNKEPPKRQQRAHHSWLECFVVTISTAPVGREAIAFQAILPPAAPFGTKMHPIQLFGWHGEIASQLGLFRTWNFTPDASLLTPQAVMRFSAIRPGHSLPSLCDALQQDYQTLEGVQYCFIQRGTNTDTLFIVTDGRPLSITPSLRAMSFGSGSFEPDIPGMPAQRMAYRLFNQALGAATVKTSKQLNQRVPPPPSTVARRSSPQVTYAAITQRPTQEMETNTRALVQQETRLIMHELSAAIGQEATTMVANAVNPLRQELKQAKEELATLKSGLEHTTATATQALLTGQGNLTLLEHQSTDVLAQRERDLEFKRLLFTTMRTAGLTLPPEAEELLYPSPPAKRRPPAGGASPMDSHG